MIGLREMIWEAPRLNEALETLARQAKLVPRTIPALGARPEQSAPLANGDNVARNHRVEQAARHLHIEAEPVSAPHSQVALFIARAAPALVQISFENSFGYLAMLKSGRTVTLIAPDLARRKFSADALRDALDPRKADR